ncbi:MAG: hypothetical protein M1308_19105 [Actinobacteria bacterium]|nr:hypothetical protein [Actinomycetota bacterium]
MLQNNPKLGIVFFAAKWFEEVVLGEKESAREFNKFMKEDTGKIKEKLQEDFELVDYPLVTSTEKAREVSKDLLAQDIDCLLLIFPVWSEDEYLLYFRDIMSIRPTVLWACTPYVNAPAKSDIMTLFRNSGIVGTFEGFGVLKKMGSKPFLVSGSYDEREPYEKIRKIGYTARVLKELKTVRLGVLPYRNEQMIVTYVDEFRLYSQLGPAVDFISVLQLKKSSKNMPESEIHKYVEEIKTKFKIDRRITAKNLFNSAQAALGLQKIIEDRQLDGLALSDLNKELHEVMGLRPCLYPEKLAHSSKVVGNEGDLGCTTGMLILQKLTGNPVMFTEIFNFDRKDNTIVAGHAGPSNYYLAQQESAVKITPDYELMDARSGISGVWMEFIGKPGRVTILNLICTLDSFQFTILGGQSLGGKVRLDGYPHYHVKIDPEINNFLVSNAENGVSHHWAIVNGDVKDELCYLADMLNIKKIKL